MPENIGNTHYPLTADGNVRINFSYDPNSDTLRGEIQTSTDSKNLAHLRESLADQMSVVANGETVRFNSIDGTQFIEIPNVSALQSIGIKIDDTEFGNVGISKTGENLSLKPDATHTLTSFETRVLASGRGRDAEYPFNARALDYSPQTDLHTHLAGTLSGETLIGIALNKPEGRELLYPVSLLKEAGIETAAYESQANNGQIKLKDVSAEDLSVLARSMSIPADTQDTFNGMETIYRFRGPIAKDKELFAPILEAIAKDYGEKGVKYAELSHAALINEPELLKIAHETLPRVKAETGVDLRFLAAMWRHSDQEWNADEVDRIKAIAKSPYIVGADFMGHETNPTRDFVPQIKQMAAWAVENDPNFTIRVHAGENPLFAATNVSEWDHNNVREALQAVVDAREEVAAKRGVPPESLPLPKIRIGHGLYGSDDETIALFKKTGAIVEFNMSSNLALNNIDDIREVPIAKYVNEGIPVVLGMDGAGIYRTKPGDEAILARQAGLDENGFEKLRSTEASHIQSDGNRFSEKQAAFEQSLVQAGAEQGSDGAWRKVLAPTYDTPDGRPRMTDEVAKRVAAERHAKITEVREAIAQSEVITDPARIQSDVGDRVPVMLTSASKSSWPKISPDQQREIQIALKMIADHVDPAKAVLVTGGTDFGGERELHRAVADRNQSLPDGQKLLLLGTFTTEAKPSEIKPGTVTHGAIMEMPGGRPAARWFDLPDTTLDLVQEKGGVMLAVGGGPVVRDMIQSAHNRGVQMILMDGPEGASTEKAVQLAGRGYDARGAEGIVKALYDQNPDLFPKDFDVAKLGEYRAAAEQAAQNIHISASEVGKLFDAKKGNAKPSPSGHRLLIRIPAVEGQNYNSTPMVDTNGNPVGISEIRDNKVIFRNPKDSVDDKYSWQKLDLDGSGVLILPVENEAMAKEMMAKLAPSLEKINAAHAGTTTFTATDLDGLLKGSYEAYVSAGKTPDIYNSDTAWVNQKMQPSASADTQNGVGLYTKKDMPLDLIVLKGNPDEVIAFSSTGKFIDGKDQFGQEKVVLIREGNEIRKMDPAYAEQHYLTADGQPLKVSELPTFEARTLKPAAVEVPVVKSVAVEQTQNTKAFITQEQALEFARSNPDQLTEAYTAGKRLYIGVNISDLASGESFSYLNPKDAPKAVMGDDGITRITILDGAPLETVKNGLTGLGKDFTVLPKGQYDNTVQIEVKGLSQDAATSLIKDIKYTSQTVKNAGSEGLANVIQASVSDVQAKEVLDWWKEQGRSQADYKNLVEKIAEIQVRDGAKIGDVYDDKASKMSGNRLISGNEVGDAGFTQDGLYVRNKTKVLIAAGDNYVLQGSDSKGDQYVEGKGILVFELDKEGKPVGVRSSAEDHATSKGNFLDADGKAITSLEAVRPAPIDQITKPAMMQQQAQLPQAGPRLSPEQLAEAQARQTKQAAGSQKGDYLEKVSTLDGLEKLTSEWRSANPNAVIGITSGVYDIMHQGHIHFLDDAKSQCDHLIVVIASDRTVKQQKGEDKPYIPEQGRAKTIAGIADVGAVIVSDELYHESILKRVKPDLMFKGDEYQGLKIHGAELVKEMRFIKCDEKEFNSSSKIAERIKASGSVEAETQAPQYPESQFKWIKSSDGNILALPLDQFSPDQRALLESRMAYLRTTNIDFDYTIRSSKSLGGAEVLQIPANGIAEQLVPQENRIALADYQKQNLAKSGSNETLVGKIPEPRVTIDVPDEASAKALGQKLYESGMNPRYDQTSEGRWQVSVAGGEDQARIAAQKLYEAGLNGHSFNQGKDGQWQVSVKSEELARLGMNDTPAPRAVSDVTPKYLGVLEVRSGSYEKGVEIATQLQKNGIASLVGSDGVISMAITTNQGVDRLASELKRVSAPEVAPGDLQASITVSGGTYEKGVEIATQLQKNGVASLVDNKGEISIPINEGHGYDHVAAGLKTVGSSLKPIEGVGNSASVNDAGVKIPSSSDTPARSGILRPEADFHNPAIGRAYGVAGLLNRINDTKEHGATTLDKTAIALDTVGLSTGATGNAAGLLGNVIGAVSQAQKGYEKGGIEEATYQGTKAATTSVISAEILAPGSTLSQVKQLKELPGAVKSLPTAIGNGVAAVKNGVTAVKEGTAIVQTVAAVKNAKDSLTLANMSSLGNAGANFAGKMGLVNAAITVTSDAADYATGRKELNLDNATGTSLDTVMNLDPLKAITSVAGLTKLVGVDTGIQNISVSTIVDRAMGGKGENISDIKNETMAIYAAEQNRFKAGELDPSLRAQRSEGTTPEMGDYKHLAALRHQIARYIPDGKIDGHDVSREFDKIDMTKPENYMAYKMGINKAMLEQEKIKIDNSSYVPRWMRYGDRATKYNEAESQLNLLGAAEKEFGMFETKMITHKREQEAQLVKQQQDRKDFATAVDKLDTNRDGKISVAELNLDKSGGSKDVLDKGDLVKIQEMLGKDAAQKFESVLQTNGVKFDGTVAVNSPPAHTPAGEDRNTQLAAR